MTWQHEEERIKREKRNLVLFVCVVSVLLVAIVALFASLRPTNPAADLQWRDQIERNNQIAVEEAQKNEELRKEKYKEKHKEHASGSP